MAQKPSRGDPLGGKDVNPEAGGMSGDVFNPSPAEDAPGGIASDVFPGADGKESDPVTGPRVPRKPG